MDREHRLRRLRFRAWHRGTREADLLVGGFCDRFSAGWSEEEIGWFERLLEEQDVDVLAWAIGARPPPPALDGPMMRQLQSINYIKHDQ